MKVTTFAKKFHDALVSSHCDSPIPDKLMKELAQHLRPSEIIALLPHLPQIDYTIYKAMRQALKAADRESMESARISYGGY